MVIASTQSDLLPPPPCNDCQDAVGCVMRGALCRELIYAWLRGDQVKGCAFYQPFEDSYHGVKGVSA